MEEMGDNKEYLEKIKEEEEAKKHHKPVRYNFLYYHIESLKNNGNQLSYQT